MTFGKRQTFTTPPLANGGTKNVPSTQQILLGSSDGNDPPSRYFSPDPTGHSVIHGVARYALYGVGALAAVIIGSQLLNATLDLALTPAQRTANAMCQVGKVAVRDQANDPTSISFVGECTARWDEKNNTGFAEGRVRGRNGFGAIVLTGYSVFMRRIDGKWIVSFVDNDD